MAKSCLLMKLCNVFFLILMAINHTSFAEMIPEVKTKNGVVRGTMLASPQGPLVHQYLGIPFAKPPIGNLRFADPEPAENWGAIDAVHYRDSCVQGLDLTYGKFQGSDMWNPKNGRSEDCLYLQVWTPAKQSQKKRTVMVWIFGGGFYSGTTSLWLYDGKALAAEADVIVASMNYRLSALGFLATGDGKIKGNFGMKDQVLALKWIKENIAAFGGDPDKITIFGESAGAASVNYHMLSPMSQNLFRRGIMHSGSADSAWAFMTDHQAKVRSAAFFKAVDCEQKNTKELLACLRQLSADTINDNSWVTTGFLEFPWAPSVDGQFLKNDPAQLLKAGQFPKKDVLLGVNKDEGTFWVVYSLPGFSKDNSSVQTYSMFLKGVGIIDFDLNSDTQSSIQKLYTPADKSNKAANRDALSHVCGDRSFVCPTEDLIMTLTKAGSEAYFYYLSYRASTEVWPDWMGVIHGADIQWVFGMPLNASRGYTESEKTLSKQIITYWADFAKNGNPNHAAMTQWPKYTTKNTKYLELRGPSQMVVRSGVHRQKYCRLWDKIQANLGKYRRS